MPTMGAAFCGRHSLCLTRERSPRGQSIPSICIAYSSHLSIDFQAWALRPYSVNLPKEPVAQRLSTPVFSTSSI